MKFFKKLNSSGAAHLIALMLVVVGAGLIGSYVIVKSHAAPATNYIQCTNKSSKFYCSFLLPSPVENSAGKTIGTFNVSASNYIICQAPGAKVTRGSYFNTAWGYTYSDSSAKYGKSQAGWVNGVYAHTGANNYGYAYLNPAGTAWVTVPTCSANYGKPPQTVVAPPVSGPTVTKMTACSLGPDGYLPDPAKFTQGNCYTLSNKIVHFGSTTGATCAFNSVNDYLNGHKQYPICFQKNNTLVLGACVETAHGHVGTVNNLPYCTGTSSGSVLCVGNITFTSVTLSDAKVSPVHLQDCYYIIPQ